VVSFPEFLSGLLPGTGRPDPGQCGEPARLRALSQGLRPALGQSAQPGGPGPGRWYPRPRRPISALDSGGLRAGHLVGAVFSNRTKSIVKSPKLYLNDTGLLCALLNIRDAARSGRRPPPGPCGKLSCWRNCVTGSAWRDRAQPLLLAGSHPRSGLPGRSRRKDRVCSRPKWTKLPDASDLVNLRFARKPWGGGRSAAPPWCAGPERIPSRSRLPGRAGGRLGVIEATARTLPTAC